MHVSCQRPFLRAVPHAAATGRTSTDASTRARPARATRSRHKCPQLADVQRFFPDGRPRTTRRQRPRVSRLHGACPQILIDISEASTVGTRLLVVLLASIDRCPQQFKEFFSPVGGPAAREAQASRGLRSTGRWQFSYRNPAHGGAVDRRIFCWFFQKRGSATFTAEIVRDVFVHLDVQGIDSAHRHSANRVDEFTFDG